jgi:NADPH:quinone reductase-like Zn-dependent oxidoreductase
MKAIVQNGYGSADVLELREIELPAVTDDTVLVAIRAASLNAADWHLLKRLPHLISLAVFRRRPPRVRGGDLAGTVESVGKNVTRFKPGDEVFGVGRGTFAEYAVAPEHALAPKPRNLTFEQAAALAIAGLTALQGLRDKGQIKAGQKVLIYGAGGGVGTFAVQIARAFGAHVTAVTRAANLELVRAIGADEVVDYTTDDFTARGQRYDVLFDVGANRSFEECRRVLAPGGVLVLAGAAGGRGLFAPIARLVKGQLLSRFGGERIVPFVARVTHEDLVALKELVESGKVSPVIDRQYSLSEVPGAMGYLGTRTARGKLVVSIRR